MLLISVLWLVASFVPYTKLDDASVSATDSDWWARVGLLGVTAVMCAGVLAWRAARPSLAGMAISLGLGATVVVASDVYQTQQLIDMAKELFRGLDPSSSLGLSRAIGWWIDVAGLALMIVPVVAGLVALALSNLWRAPEWRERIWWAPICMLGVAVWVVTFIPVHVTVEASGVDGLIGAGPTSHFSWFTGPEGLLAGLALAALLIGCLAAAAAVLVIDRPSMALGALWGAWLYGLAAIARWLNRLTDAADGTSVEWSAWAMVAVVAQVLALAALCALVFAIRQRNRHNQLETLG